VTTCTRERTPWLNSHEVHQILRTVWTEADSWLVGRYVVMPDHVHLFATPNGDLSLERWIQYWKSICAKRLGQPQAWQRGHWDTRMRNVSSYHEKWEYVRENPVRHGLVDSADQWPLQGIVHDIQW